MHGLVATTPGKYLTHRKPAQFPEVAGKSMAEAVGEFTLAIERMARVDSVRLVSQKHTASERNQQDQSEEPWVRMQNCDN